MSPQETAIQKRAYELWEKDGRPHGRHEAHWAEARRQLLDEEAMSAAAVPPRPKTSTVKTPKTAATKAKPVKPAKATAGAALAAKPRKPASGTARRPGPA